MDRLPPKLIVFLGLFCGASLSTAWFSVRPFDPIGAVCVGTAACALVLIMLRVDRTLVKKNRRSSDHESVEPMV